MGEARCLLSVAMIVKDEENNLPRCLDSIKDFVDEIIIVDTGSKDRTVEIARRYTDKIYFFQWNNDFSAARNYSLQFPKGEWVLIIDADEEAAEDMKKGLREYLANLPPEVNTVYLPTISYLDWDFKNQEVASSARIFRNGTVHFENIVHNQAIYKGKVVYAPFTIIHYGYIWTRKLRKKKHARTATLIREHLKNVKSLPEKLYYLVQLYKTESVSPKYWSHVRVGWEIANLLSGAETIPTIAFEFMYIFGMELLSNEIVDGEKLLHHLIKIVPGYPDPYCGLAIHHFNRKEYEKSYEFARIYFALLEKVMSEKEKFTWTINSLKEMDKLNVVMLIDALHVDDKTWVDRCLEKINSVTDLGLLSVFCAGVVDAFSKKDRVWIEKYWYVFLQALKIAYKNKIAPRLRELLVNFLSEGISIKTEEEIDLLCAFPVGSKMDYWLREKLVNRSVDYIYSYFLSDTKEEDFLDQYGVAGIVFLYYLKKDYYDSERILSWLKSLESRTENVLFKGLIEALIGDTYLKMKRLRSALDSYRSAYRDNPLIASFIKPIIEDLKTDLIDLEIEGVADELWKYYTTNNEFVIPLDKYPKDELELVYLLSNHDFAKYVSALATSDPKKKIELLNSIAKPEMFSYYYYHLAKAYERIDIELAYSHHIKAIENNEKLADIKEKKYNYTELYPACVQEFYNPNDPKVWVGNLSERFSCQNIIQPVRTWKRSKSGLLYAIPFPTEQSLKLFLEREHKAYGRNLMLPSSEFLEEMLSEVSWDDVTLYYDVNESSFDFSLLKRLGIEITTNSKNLLVLCGIERKTNLDFLKKANRALIFVHLPKMDDRDDDVWYYPGFVVLRSYRFLKNEIEKIGFVEVKKRLKGSLLSLLIRKKD